MAATRMVPESDPQPSNQLGQDHAGGHIPFRGSRNPVENDSRDEQDYQEKSHRINHKNGQIRL